MGLLFMMPQIILYVRRRGRSRQAATSGGSMLNIYGFHESNQYTGALSHVLHV